MRRRHADNRNIVGLRVGFEMFAYFIAAHHRHHDIKENYGRLFGLRDVQGADAVVGRDALESFILERPLNQSNDIGFIVDD